MFLKRLLLLFTKVTILGFITGSFGGILSLQQPFSGLMKLKENETIY